MWQSLQCHKLNYIDLWFNFGSTKESIISRINYYVWYGNRKSSEKYPKIIGTIDEMVLINYFIYLFVYYFHFMRQELDKWNEIIIYKSQEG